MDSIRSWDKLNLSEKSDIMAAAVRHGITSLQDIRNKWNEFAEGGKMPDTVGEYADAIYQNAVEEPYGDPSPHYNNVDIELMQRLTPDSRGHYDDSVKLSNHPSSPVKGTFNGRYFDLTDRGMQNPNYTLFGLIDNGDADTTLRYNGSYVLPEVTVTPKGNYYDDTYNNIRIMPWDNNVISQLTQYSDGGHLYKNGGPKDSGEQDRIRFAMNFFMDKGLSREAAAGLVGNLMRESGLNPTVINKNSGAYGIAQWLGPRKKKLFETYGNNPSFEQQLDYVWYELNSTHKKGLQMLKASKTADEAARNAFGYYEFSAGPEAAIKEMNKYGQAGNRSLDQGIANAQNIYGTGLYGISPVKSNPYKLPVDNVPVWMPAYPTYITEFPQSSTVTTDNNDNDETFLPWANTKADNTSAGFDFLSSLPSLPVDSSAESAAPLPWVNEQQHKTEGLFSAIDFINSKRQAREQNIISNTTDEQPAFMQDYAQPQFVFPVRQFEKGGRTDSEGDGDNVTYNGGIIPPVTISAKDTGVRPIVYWDPYTGRFKGIGYGGKEYELGEGYDPSKSYILTNPEDYERAKLTKYYKDDPNHYVSFGNDVQGLVLGILPTPAEGSVIDIASSKVVKPLIKNTQRLFRNMRDYRNLKNFIDRYGYKYKPKLGLIFDDNKLDRLTNQLVEQHNTFARGVDVNEARQFYGFPESMSDEAIAEYTLTHSHRPTVQNAGGNPERIPVLYTSNSIQLAKSYTNGDGYVGILQRPIQQYKDRSEFLMKNDFRFHRNKDLKYSGTTDEPYILHRPHLSYNMSTLPYDEGRLALVRKGRARPKYSATKLTDTDALASAGSSLYPQFYPYDPDFKHYLFLGNEENPTLFLKHMFKNKQNFRVTDYAKHSVGFSKKKSDGGLI